VGLGLTDPEAAAAKLVEVGLWSECEEGWTVGEERWARYQSTREQVEEEREKARERQRKSRRNTSANNNGDAETSRECHAVTETTSRERHEEVRLPEREREKRREEKRQLDEEGESEGEDFAEAEIGLPGERAQEDLPHSEPVPDSNSPPKTNGVAADGQPYRVHIDAFLGRWNEICRNRGWKQTHTLSESRREMLRHRMRDPCWLAVWRQALDHFEERIKWPKRPKKGLATLDWWIRNDRNLHRVLEGDYDDHDRSIGNGDPEF
jgi:hypothetical protein